MIIEEIEENPNCRGSDMMRYRETGPPQKVIQVRLYHEVPEGKLYWVTGWNDRDGTPVSPATVQPVEDSGSGVAYLLQGGNCGLRFKPAESMKPWDLSDPAQWGEPFLLLGDLQDLVIGRV